jgi:hypothetical protein
MQIGIMRVLNLSRHLFVVALLCCCLSSVRPQKTNNTNQQPLIDSEKPAVYLSFVCELGIKVDGEIRDPNNLFFRLTNNSRWPIWINMSDVSKKEYGDASLYFSIENKEDGAVQDGSRFCHVCSVNPIRPGGSIVFSIAKNVASRERRMRVTYSYEWERDVENLAGSNSEHSVTYYFSSLPESVLP